jgi:protocatechuate 3,4-dioxygenase beta subunit
MTDHELSRRRLLALGSCCVAGTALAGGGGGTAYATGREVYMLAANDAAGPRSRLLEGTPMRADITDGKPGVPLTLRLSLREPVADTAVEVWHSDAWGYYSGYAEASPGGEAPTPRADGSGADSKTYLRGYQVAGDDGTVEFTTIVPGWYVPRAPHVHVRVLTPGRSHAGQLFFDDAVVASAYARGPYARHLGDGPARLADDPVYGGGGARDGLLDVEPHGDGYLATLTLGLDRLD